MKEQHTEHEIIRGKLYRYDSDYDAYYRLQQSESTISKWSWIVFSVILAAIAYYLEFHAK
jgi:hypothetical protein